MMKGTQVIRSEHLTIKRALQVLDKICNELEKKNSVDPWHIEQILNFIKVYVDLYHHGREEEVLLPFIVKTADCPWLEMETIQEDHLLHRGYVMAMSQALDLGIAGNYHLATAQFVQQARNFIGMLSEHIFKEETLLLPRAEIFFSPAQQEELFENYRFFEEEKGFGKIIGEMCLQLEALEKEYVPHEKLSECCGCGLGPLQNLDELTKS